eukprot:CAMPEP_0178446504 /NCGR_PEP_ID=MMETSP0689_2-20121128/40842_1 /TAXON_ID=160604 /ORGANISM="Amphidinium massartii, Strain CS-259" /LENGTH=50 /DNA_ID=CAMNT_0020071339 /DNA_START=40 /DNA_END=188 /DNA_ORIENTATION=+
MSSTQQQQAHKSGGGTSLLSTEKDGKLCLSLKASLAKTSQGPRAQVPQQR